MYSNLICSLNAPIVFNIQQNGAKYIKFFVLDSEENILATLEKQARNSQASFDVAYILQNSIKEKQQRLILRNIQQQAVTQETTVFEDDRICVKFKVGWQIDERPKQYNNRIFFAVNSKPFDQKQEYITSNIANTVPAKILSAGKLIKYEGYPLSVTCQSSLGDAQNLPKTSYRTLRGIRMLGNSTDREAGYLSTSNGHITSFGSGIIIRGNNTQTLYEGVFNVEIDKKDGDSFLLNSVNGSISREIEQRNCDIKQPYYLKWVNLDGGWQYFMFSFHQQLQHKKDGQEILKGYQQNAFDLKRTAIGSKYERTLTIGAENLSKEQFNNLYSLLYSDFVFHYDEQKQEWEKVFIDNQSLTHSTNGRSFEVEFSVIL